MGRSWITRRETWRRRRTPPSSTKVWISPSICWISLPFKKWMEEISYLDKIYHSFHFILIFFQSWKQFALPVITTMFLWQLIHLGTWWTVHIVPKYMSCHRAIVVITGEAHCFHDCIYIALIWHLWNLSALWVVDHLWPLIIYTKSYNLIKIIPIQNLQFYNSIFQENKIYNFKIHLFSFLSIKQTNDPNVLNTTLDNFNLTKIFCNMRVRHRNLDDMFRLILLIRGRIMKKYVKIYIGNLRSFMVVNLKKKNCNRF